MKTKIVTIHNWDGSKYTVEAPINAKYIGIFNCTGAIRFFSRKPKLGGVYYSNRYQINKRDANSGYSAIQCPAKNLPFHDGYGQTEELPQLELLIEIEEV